MTNGIIRLVKWLGPFGKLHVLLACCAFSGMIVLTFAYRPVIIKLSHAANALFELEAKLLSQRSAVAVLEKSDVRVRTIWRNEVPLVIQELTEKGRDLGLHFSAISPIELQDTTEASIRRLPIRFAIESEYKSAGQFLAYLEGFSRSIVEVESLSIRPKEKNNPMLNVEFVLNLYVEIDNEAS